jgi:hypothetical protein
MQALLHVALSDRLRLSLMFYQVPCHPHKLMSHPTCPLLSTPGNSLCKEPLVFEVTMCAQSLSIGRKETANYFTAISMSSVSSRTGHPASSNNCAKDQDHWPQLPLNSSQHRTNVPNFEIDLNTTLTYAGLDLNDFDFLLPWPSNEDSFPATALPTETHGQFFAQFQSDLRPTSIGTTWSPRGASGQNAGLAVENSMALSSYQPSHMVLPMGMPTTCGVSTDSGPFPISSAAPSSLQQYFEGSSPSTISEPDDSSSSSWSLGSQRISGDTVNTLAESDRTSLKPLLPMTSSQLARMQMPPTKLAPGANPKKRTREEAQIQEPSVRAGDFPEGLVLLPSIGTEDQKDRNHKRRRSNESERGAIKACVRCRVYRIKVWKTPPLSQKKAASNIQCKQCEGDHGKTCNRCAKSLEKSKIFTQPCLRLSLDDVQAFRAGNSRVGQFRSTLPTYRWSTENPEIRRIRISFQFPPSILTGRDAPSLLVTCREFLPSTEDQLTNTVVSSDGDEITINFPAYACVSMIPFGTSKYTLYWMHPDRCTKLDAHTTKTQRAMNTFLDCCQPLAEATLDNTIHDDIIKLSLAEARRYAQSRTVRSSDEYLFSTQIILTYF